MKRRTRRFLISASGFVAALAVYSIPRPASAAMTICPGWFTACVQQCGQIYCAPGCLTQSCSYDPGCDNNDPSAIYLEICSN